MFTPDCSDLPLFQTFLTRNLLSPVLSHRVFDTTYFLYNKEGLRTFQALLQATVGITIYTSATVKMSKGQVLTRGSKLAAMRRKTRLREGGLESSCTGDR